MTRFHKVFFVFFQDSKISEVTVPHISASNGHCPSLLEDKSMNYTWNSTCKETLGQKHSVISSCLFPRVVFIAPQGRPFPVMTCPTGHSVTGWTKISLLPKQDTTQQKQEEKQRKIKFKGLILITVSLEIFGVNRF